MTSAERSGSATGLRAVGASASELHCKQPLRESVGSIWLSRQPPARAALEHVLGREAETARGLDSDADLVGLVGVGDRQGVGASGASASSSCAAAVAPSVAGSATTTRSGFSSASRPRELADAGAIGRGTLGVSSTASAVAARTAQRPQRARGCLPARASSACGLRIMLQFLGAAAASRVIVAKLAGSELLLR